MDVNGKSILVNQYYGISITIIGESILMNDWGISMKGSYCWGNLMESLSFFLMIGEYL
jgi:hypothetical protein